MNSRKVGKNIKEPKSDKATPKIRKIFAQAYEANSHELEQKFDANVKPRIIEMFALALEDITELHSRIQLLSASRKPTVRDQLKLAWYRNYLRFLEPNLPPETPLTPANIWKYWGVDHPDECQVLRSEQEEIESYLLSPEEASTEANSNMEQILELISADSTLFLALAPLRFKKKPGRHIERAQVASALCR